MTRERFLMFIGILVLLSPWSGLPLSWLTWILLVLGLLVLAIGYSLRKRGDANDFPNPPALHSVSSASETPAEAVAETLADRPRRPVSRTFS